MGEKQTDGKITQGFFFYGGDITVRTKSYILGLQFLRCWEYMKMFGSTPAAHSGTFCVPCQHILKLAQAALAWR